MKKFTVIYQRSIYGTMKVKAKNEVEAIVIAESQRFKIRECPDLTKKEGGLYWDVLEAKQED